MKSKCRRNRTQKDRIRDVCSEITNSGSHSVLSLLLRLLLLLGLVSLGLGLSRRLSLSLSLSLSLALALALALVLLRLEVLVIDSHGLVNLGDQSGLVLKPG